MCLISDGEAALLNIRATIAFLNQAADDLGCKVNTTKSLPSPIQRAPQTFLESFLIILSERTLFVLTLTVAYPVRTGLDRCWKWLDLDFHNDPANWMEVIPPQVPNWDQSEPIIRLSASHSGSALAATRSALKGYFGHISFFL
jgi:hypothetical protein